MCNKITGNIDAFWVMIELVVTKWNSDTTWVDQLITAQTKIQIT